MQFSPVDQPDHSTVSFEEMSKYIRCREHLHESMLRENYVLPTVSSACVTLDWLTKVRSKVIYCPMRNTDTNFKQCYSPPPRKILQEKLVEGVRMRFHNGELKDDLVDPIKRLIMSLSKKPANVGFYLKLLSIFKPEDEIFEKKYKYSRPDTAKQSLRVNNSDGLIDELPQLSEKEIRSKNRLRMSRSDALALKIAQSEARLEKMQMMQLQMKEQLTKIEKVEREKADELEFDLFGQSSAQSQLFNPVDATMEEERKEPQIVPSKSPQRQTPAGMKSRSQRKRDSSVRKSFNNMQI